MFDIEDFINDNIKKDSRNKMSKKRVVIFSPEGETQQKIAEEVIVAIGDMLKKYSVDWGASNSFTDLADANYKKKKLSDGTEVLVIFDKYLEIRDKRRPIYAMTSPQRIYARALKQVIVASQHLCDEKGIPYITYNGEMHTGHAIIFREKIKSLEERILRKILEDSA